MKRAPKKPLTRQMRTRMDQDQDQDQDQDDKPASDSIDQLHVPVQPKPFELGEDIEGGELLQVEDLDVRHPDLVHQGDVHGDQRIVLVSKLKDFFYDIGNVLAI